MLLVCFCDSLVMWELCTKMTHAVQTHDPPSWALLQAMHESQRERWAVAYARRALPAFPAAVDASRLAAALDAAAKLLPVGSLAPVLVAQQVAQRCTELLRQADASQGFQVPGDPAAQAQQQVQQQRQQVQPPPHVHQHPSSVQSAGSGAAADASQPAAGAAAAETAALQLAQLLAHLLLVVDFHVLPDVMDTAEAAALAALQPSVRRQVRSS